MIRTILRQGLSMPSGKIRKHLFAGKRFEVAVEEALEQTQRREKRKRSLPAHAMVLLVVALSLFRNLSIPAAYRRLMGWGARKKRLGAKAVTDEALIHARKRLGPEVLRCLFEKLAASIQVAATFRGLCVHAIDGVRLSLPDTKANEKRFGRWTASAGDRTAFPQALVVALIACHTRLVRALRIERAVEGERDACASFLDLLGPKDIVLLDRGFHAVWLFQKFLQKGVRFLCRASASYKPRVVLQLGRGDYLVHVKAWVPDESGRQKKVTLLLRMIEYRVGKRQSVRLLTDLLSRRHYPALAIAKLYRERWESELAYDEIKTHLATPPHGSVQLPVRSKNPNGVLQEIYGLFIAYNLIRDFISAATENRNIAPREISFVGALEVIHFALFGHGGIPELTPMLQRLILQKRMKRTRRNRWYPRVIRIKHKHYPRKRSYNEEHRIDYEALLRLVDLVSDHRAAA